MSDWDDGYSVGLEEGLEQGKKEGAKEEINYWLEQLNDIHGCNDTYCEGAIFKREIRDRFKKRLRELEGKQ